MEICLDCKDKVIKFFHFKRQVKEVQMNRKFSPKRHVKPKKHKRSKVVHDIFKIIKNYTDECSVASIKVDKSTKRLVIEPAVNFKYDQIEDESNVIETDQDTEMLEENYDIEAAMPDPINIKEEVFGEPIYYTEEEEIEYNDDDKDDHDFDDNDKDDNDDNKKSFQDRFENYSSNLGGSTSKETNSSKGESLNISFLKLN